jgi:hypothetical protein
LLRLHLWLGLRRHWCFIGVVKIAEIIVRLLSLCKIVKIVTKIVVIIVEVVLSRRWC